jgi:ribosomal protein S17E
MYISIKKGKKEEITEEERDLFTKKFDDFKHIVDKIVKY